VAVFAGPTFAAELLQRFPSGAVAAAEDPELARAVQELFMNETLRMYTTTDVVGVEVGGALKNVYAIAAGVCQGVGLGSNTVALLCTRGIKEMNQLAVEMGATHPTLAGLTGVGDLMLTCMGGLSRNAAVGVRLGQGESLQEILATMDEVAEGVHTASAAQALCEKHGVHAPIVEAMNNVLDGRLEPAQAIHQLMTRPVKNELIFDPALFPELVGRSGGDNGGAGGKGGVDSALGGDADGGAGGEDGGDANSDGSRLTSAPPPISSKSSQDSTFNTNT
jgi:glycerol-3-phosphate dehydrogenase (NAD(P)+)